MNRPPKSNLQNTGFTIVELIVVIVVIAILAAISLVSYNIIRDRAKATAIASEITKVEEAFHLMASEQFTTEWWRDNYFTGSGNPTFGSIISSSNPNAALFKKYLPDVPKVSGMDLTWTYDNDKDADIDPKDSCGLGWVGVVLYIDNIDEALQQKVDDEMDDGDLKCGKIRTWSSHSMLYQISFRQKV